MKSRVPRFLVPPRRLYTGWLGSLSVLLSREHARQQKLDATVAPPYSLTESQSRLPRGALFSSVVVHVFVLFSLARFPFFLHGSAAAQAAPYADHEKIVYDLRMVNIADSLPTVKSPGPGGRPGKGTQPDKLPPRGSDAFHPHLTVVMNPPKPDNNRQTIIQSASPPDLVIPHEVRLPNIFAGNLEAAPKAPLQFRAPAVPNRPAKEAIPAPQAPAIAAAPSGVDLPPDALPNAAARLQVPRRYTPSLQMSNQRAQTGATGAGGGEGAPSAGAGLLAIGVDPGDISNLVAIPLGNRYGAFSTSPAGGQPGSPGGVPGGNPQGGSGGAGTGGDASEGVGPGNNGGGGGNAGARHGFTIMGGSGKSGMEKNNNPEVGHAAASRKVGAVFPVILSPSQRRIALVVSTGPIGGGGLDVYDVLRGGKIYTVFLPMPGKNWVLQFCLHKEQSAGPQSEAPRGVVNLEPPLLPPEPTELFDFGRASLPAEDSEKRIIVHGFLGRDGSLTGLTLVRGVSPSMDEAAVAAFSKWKFKPALRANEPVEVEILVGIPARVTGP